MDQKSGRFASGIGYSIRPKYFSKAELFSAQIDSSMVPRSTFCHLAVPDQDALNVNVLVNFVMADNKLLGSESSNVSQISAGSDYAVGDELTFPEGAPIERLEVVVQVASHGLHGALPPAIVNAGQAMVEPPNVKMTGYNKSATEPARVVIFYVSDPDTPFLDPVR